MTTKHPQEIHVQETVYNVLKKESDTERLSKNITTRNVSSVKSKNTLN